MTGSKLFRRSAIAAALFVVATLLALMSHAGLSLKVTPIPIVITGSGTSTMVELRNEGTETIRLQASTFDWSQTADGEDVLNATGEMLVFPSMLTLKPKEARKVRVGTKAGYASHEKSFRVIFSEIPSNVRSGSDPAQVKVVTRVSIPIFVKPAGSAPALEVLGLTATKDKVAFQIRNTGGAHALLHQVDVKFLNAQGQVLSTANVPGWYVLPGIVRPFQLALGKDASCAGASSLVVTASTSTGESTSKTLPAPACAN